MPEIKALEVAIEEDLRPLSTYLWRSGFAHRIIEQAGQQVVLVRTPMQAEAVRDLHVQMQRGEVLPLPELPAIRKSPVLSSLHTPTPVTFIFITLSVIGFFVGGFNSSFESWLTFFRFDQLGNYTFFSLASGQYWRLFTPMFLHFSLQHIIFNMLLFWFWGKKIEQTQGSLRLFAIVMLMAMGSNIAQAIISGVSIFGGMSGVDFGLFGYCLSWSLLFPKSVLRVEKPFIVMMLITLVFGFINLNELLGMGRVANVAHVSGLVLGLVLGLAMGLIAKVER